MEDMQVFDADTSVVPKIGIFWFDEDSESLFEVHTKDFDPDRVVNGLLLYIKTHEFWWEKARSASCNRSSSLYELKLQKAHAFRHGMNAAYFFF